MLDRSLKLMNLLLLSTLFSGCAKNFQVVAEIPPPLIQPSALVAQMEYSDEFKTYKFVEKSDDRSLESVDFGVAQVSLFDRIFDSLFSLSSSGTEGHDIKIEPQILDFQYSAPKETKLKLYEVWVKYRVKVSDSKNEELADWVVKGYGKTPTRMLSSHLKAFNTACNVALRDVGAQLAIGFRNQPSIKDYLASKLGGAESLASELNPKQSEGGDNTLDTSQGAVDLADGSLEITEGSSEIAESTAEIAEGTAEIAEGTAEIAEGSLKTADGTSSSQESSADTQKKVEAPTGLPDEALDLDLVSSLDSDVIEMSYDSFVVDQFDEEAQ